MNLEKSKTTFSKFKKIITIFKTEVIFIFIELIIINKVFPNNYYLLIGFN